MTTLSILGLFAKVSPELLDRHAEFFLPYVTASAKSPLRMQVLCQVMSILELVVPAIQRPSGSFLGEIDDRLCEVIRDGGVKAITVAVRCLKAVLDPLKNFKSKISLHFLMQFQYLTTLKTKLEDDPGFEFESPEVKRNAMRCVYTLGVMFRYFDFDQMLNSSENVEIMAEYNRLNESDGSIEARANERRSRGSSAGLPSVLREYVFACLLYFVESRVAELSLKALAAIGQMIAGWTDFASDSELTRLYDYLLNSGKEEFEALKIQVMRNLTSFIAAQVEVEKRVNREIKAERTSGVGLLELKTMDSFVAELSSRVIQSHWPAIVSCYSNSGDRVRVVAARLVKQILQEGLVSPASAIPALLQMSKDPIEGIRVQMQEQYDQMIRDHPEILQMVNARENAYDYDVDIARHGEMEED